MSVQNLLGDIFCGNFSNALKPLEDWWSGVSPRLKACITQAETGQGKILESLTATGAHTSAIGYCCPLWLCRRTKGKKPSGLLYLGLQLVKPGSRPNLALHTAKPYLI